MSEEMKCKNCKYHYIEELTFDYPQSCCRKRSEITEQWCKCNDFEYGDRYIEQLQQENKELKRNCNIGNENLTFYKEENTQLKSVLKEIREYIDELYDNTDDTTCYDIDRHRKEFLLEIIDKEIAEEKIEALKSESDK